MFRRRNYFIKKKFQTNFLYKFLLLLIVESILIVGLFIHISANTMTTGYKNSVLIVECTQNFFLIRFAFLTMIIVLGVGLAGMFVFILLSHRIAGPLFRFEKTLGQLKDGDLSTLVHLRSTDQLPELQESLNSLIESLALRIGGIKRMLNEIDINNVDPHVGQKLKEIKNEINRFKLPAGSDISK